MVFHKRAKPLHPISTRLFDHQRVRLDDRLAELGISQSSYIRNLVERDLSGAGNLPGEIRFALESLTALRVELRMYLAAVFGDRNVDLATLSRQAEAVAGPELDGAKSRWERRQELFGDMAKGKGV